MLSNIPSKCVWFALAIALLLNGTRARAEGGRGGVWAQPNGKFVLYDATNYKHRPKLEQFGLPRLGGVYAGTIWPKGSDRDQMPAQWYIQRIARWYGLRYHTMFVDIEHWPTQTLNGHADPAEVVRNQQRLKRLVGWFKAGAPKLRVGLYGTLPISEYAGPARDIQWRVDRAKQDDRRFLKTGLADAVDVVFPSLYVRYSNDPEQWKKYARFKLKEAKLYGKPVYPFLRPQYVEDASKKLRGKSISRKFWRIQLEFCKKHAEGAVIWSRPDEQWNPDAGWWQATRAFLRQHE